MRSGATSSARRAKKTWGSAGGGLGDELLGGYGSGFQPSGPH